MRDRHGQVFGLALGLLAVLAAIASLPPAKGAWLRLSGAVMPSGSRTHTYHDRPVRILSAEGRRWAAWDELEDASAYHALVLFPHGELRDTWSSSGGDGFTHTSVERWQWSRGQPGGGFEERELKIVYDALWRTVTVNSRTYRVADGTLFVVRFGEQSHPAVTQLEAPLDGGAGMKEAVDAFKAELPEDMMVQQLYYVGGDIRRHHVIGR